MSELSTAPNSAIPAYRKKPALDESGATKHAAGVLHVAPDGHVLLLRRSGEEANFAHHWALPGGGVEDGESPAQGAEREVAEETGTKIEGGPMKLLDQRRTPTGTIFHTFARPVSEKFTPTLNAEHSGFCWSPLDALPQPMHPAVASTLRERVGMADDMKPEDWTGLRDGFLKWTREEEAEPEHGGANDSALRSLLALDRSSVRTKDRDGRLHVAITNLCKVGVNPYRGSEIPNCEKLGLDPNQIYKLFRSPEALKKATPTINGVPLMRKHVPVSADDHQPWDVCGAIGTSAEFDGTYIKNGLTIWAEADINGVESEDKFQLSPGYHYVPEMTAGSFDGESFDGKMEDIEFNHVAIVVTGRQGDDVVVGDEEPNMSIWEKLEHAILGLRP